MNQLKLSAAAIVFILMAGYILYLTQCSRPSCPPTLMKYASVDTQRIIREYTAGTTPTIKVIYKPGDTIRITKTIPGKPPLPKIIEIVKQVPKDVDTVAILRDYYSKKVQEDSLVRPDFTVKTSDTLQYNTILGRAWTMSYNTKTITKTPLPLRIIYFGGGGHHSKTDFISEAHIDLGYINRKGQHIKVDLSLSNNQLQYGASFYQTIWTIH